MLFIRHHTSCLVTVVLLLLAACEDASQPNSEVPTYARQKLLRGSLHISSSSVTGSLVRDWTAAFRSYHPELGISLEIAGSGQAASALISRGVDLAVLSRLMTPEERDRFVLSHGYAPTPIAVGRDAVAVYVHADNPIGGLTLPQLDAVFSTTRLAGHPKPIERWKDLGLDGEWADADVHVYGLELTSSTTMFFNETVLLGGAYKPEMQRLSGSTVLVSAILVDKYGIGFGPIADSRPGVRALPLPATSSGLVMPSEASVNDGSYALSRPLYVYFDRPPNMPVSPALSEFVDYVLSRRGREQLEAHGFFSAGN